VTFMFPGGSSQYENMARELYKNEPVFREELDEAAESLGEATGADVRSFLYPASAAGELERPTRALPALFATELALARLWMSWGVRPRDLIGHSLGEYVAACLAGVMSTKDAACLVAFRSRLFEQLPPGRMLAVSLPEDELVPLLDDRLGVAAVNGPAATVVSGPLDAVDELERALEQRGVEARRLKIGVAAHSPLVDAVVEEFRSFVRTIDLAPPKIPIVSNLTGDWIQAEDATDPEYWARQLRMTVRFADGVGLLLQSGDRVLLEVGPGRALAALAGRHPSRRPEHIFLSSLPHPSESTSALAFAYTTLARLWVGGADVDWSRFQAHETRRRARLPTYPFQREYFWVTQGGGEEGAAPLQVAPAAAETDGDVDLRDVLLAQIEVMNRQLDSLDALRGGSA
jgi:phthiocerol/phenolphthiocerol synthesis type-I polyketide synthase E